MKKKKDLIIMKATNDLKANEVKIIKVLILNLQIPHLVRFEAQIIFSVHFSFF